MAIGGRPIDISWLVIKDVMLLVLAAARSGIAVAIAAGRLVTGFLVYGGAGGDSGCL